MPRKARGTPSRQGLRTLGGRATPVPCPRAGVPWKEPLSTTATAPAAAWWTLLLAGNLFAATSLRCHSSPPTSPTPTTAPRRVLNSAKSAVLLLVVAVVPLQLRSRGKWPGAWTRLPTRVTLRQPDGFEVLPSTSLDWWIVYWLPIRGRDLLYLQSTARRGPGWQPWVLRGSCLLPCPNKGVLRLTGPRASARRASHQIAEVEVVARMLRCPVRSASCNAGTATCTPLRTTTPCTKLTL